VALKKSIVVVLSFFLLNSSGYGQDIPLFTQKLTNSFLYNPSVAGNTLGSFTISRRQYWSGIDGSPNTNFLSLHVPLAQHKVGFGVNLFLDNLGVSQTTFASAAFAYHIRFTDNNSLSMGSSVEYAIFNLNQVRIDVLDPDDPLLTQLNTYSKLDFSYGMSYQARLFKVGASVNRISDLISARRISNLRRSRSDSTNNRFPAYYSAFFGLRLPVFKDRDQFEPVVTYRSLSPGSHQIDAGLYYTLKETLTIGGGYRTGGVINATIGLRIKKVLIGYGREMLSANYQQSIGSSNEITLRIDFRDHTYHVKTKNSRKISTQALAIRRKTLSNYSSKGNASQWSQRYKKKVKKNYINSPNYRISTSKKLQTVKSKKSLSYKKKKRKPASRRRF
jgi:type IX secretion system PorP/SprF family membrane protein